MIFIDACLGKKTQYTPTWLMRQAGRYLSEYREVRKDAGDFLSLCKNVDLATKVTLQPVDILDVDAAIIFSDILVVPLEMGMELEFISGEGPVFKKPLDSNLEFLKRDGYKRMEYVYNIISNTRAKLSKDKALIGFSGAPWTVATYMIEGRGSKSYEKSKKILYSNPAFLHNLMEILTENIKHYLSMQISAGADCVMLFDSWANALEYSAYLEFGWKYIQEITHFLKQRHPQIPIIAFPRGTGAFLDKLDGIFDVMGIDYQTPLSVAKNKIGDKFVLQGNLEPARLYSEAKMNEGVEEIINIMQNTRHIFNLGHGMIKDLPRDNAIKLIKNVREISSRF